MAPADPDETDPRTHLRVLDHPIVQCYVSLRSFGNLTPLLDAVIAEIRSRTRPGARIYCAGCGAAGDEVKMAQALPDRTFVATDPSGALIDRARRHGAEAVQNLELAVADLDDPPLDPNSYDIITALRSVHHAERLELFWQRCRAALRPGGVVLAQEYVGPPGLRWPEVQRRAAERVARDLPPPHAPGEPMSAVSLADLRPADRRLAPRSHELIPTCLDAGFTFQGEVRAGCALVLPVLLGRIGTFEPTNWQHNLVLSELFREEDELMRGEVLGSDFAMFVAAPG